MNRYQLGFEPQWDALYRLRIKELLLVLIYPFGHNVTRQNQPSTWTKRTLGSTSITVE